MSSKAVWVNTIFSHYLHIFSDLSDQIYFFLKHQVNSVYPVALHFCDSILKLALAHTINTQGCSISVIKKERVISFSLELPTSSALLLKKTLLFFHSGMLFYCIPSFTGTQIHLKPELWCFWSINICWAIDCVNECCFKSFLFPTALPYLPKFTELITFAMKAHIDSLKLQVDGCSLLLEILTQGTVTTFPTNAG